MVCITPDFLFKLWLVQCSRLAALGERVRQLQCVSFYLTDESSYPPFSFIIKLSSYNILPVFLSFLSLIVVRWCHLDMKVETSCIPPAVLSAGWPVGRRKFSTGMDSQQSVYLYLIIWQLQGRESCGSTIPSWCLISHSFSYRIFLFKAAL